MKKIIIIFVLILILSTAKFFILDIKKGLELPKLNIISDIDNDGITDIDDFLEGAREEIKNKTNYRSAYYSGGYPPENEGVCSDVIWRAFKAMGVDLKTLLDDDVRKNISKYDRVNGTQDTNIDFRRVPNLEDFFRRNALNLSSDLIIGNVDNLTQWQGGDIVTFGQPNQHIAIISDRRDKNGVPYLIHNYSDFPKEDIWVLYADKKKFPITGHFRWKY